MSDYNYYYTYSCGIIIIVIINEYNCYIVEKNTNNTLSLMEYNIQKIRLIQ